MDFNITSIPFSIEEATTQLEPLVLLVIGIAIYGIFVFKFYRFLGKKDIFELNLVEYNSASHPVLQKFVHVILYFLEFLFIFPLFVFLWTVVVTVFISLVSSLSFEYVFLAAMGLVSATRMTAYYNEELSRDMAKTIPFALLGIMIIDYTAVNIAVVWQSLLNVLTNWKISVYYLFLAMLLEICLRGITGFIKLFKKD